jgi:glycosyltransferase involved in cell wall biosynthesis
MGKLKVGDKMRQPMCAKDDAGDCCGKCGIKEARIVAVVPVLGRRPLVKHTIERLYKKNSIHKVICVGDDPRDRKVCEAAGAEWIHHRNRPLGQKWNTGFRAAQKYNPDACLFVGSSDWVSDTWTAVLSQYLSNYDLIGLPGCYFLDITSTLQAHRALFWPGYIGKREGESIGIGRLISAKVLDKLKWEPFDDVLDRSLDFSMQKKVLQAGGKLKLLQTDVIKSLSISCDQWKNKHNFESHWNNVLPSEKIEVDKIVEWFPEVKLIFE